MLKLNVHAAKTHLSRYLSRVKAGETILLCRRNVPIAEIRPLRARPQKPRPVGLGKESFQVPSSFFDPLPEAEVRRFEGADD